MIIMEDPSVEDILSLSSLAEIVIKCPPEITAYLTGAAFTRFNQSAAAGDSFFDPNAVSGNNDQHHLYGVTSDWSLSSMSSSSVPTPSGILRNHQQELQSHNSLSSARQHEEMQRLKYYSYGIALPAICILGILGNVLNLIVLTRPSMRGPAYVYMRGTDYVITSLLFIQFY
jgi:hypothetical protein